MPGLLSAAYGILLPPNRPVRGQSALALLLPLLLAAALLLLVVAGPVQAQNVDYDTDNDGLIDIDSPAKLIAIAYDLNGDGTAAAGSETDYAAGFLNPLSTQCASTADPSQTCSGYELTADITLTANWTPTGSYTATFDGNGHRINGLTINVSSGNAGLFGDLGATGVIRDVAIISPSITSSSGDDTGALVGESANGSRISASYVSAGTVSSTGTNATVGGLVGYAYGAIRASYSTATVSATGSGAVTGGMVGLLNSDTNLVTFGIASIVVSLCKIGVEINSAIAVSNGTVIIPLLHFGGAPVDISLCVVGVEDNGKVVVGNRTVSISQPVFGDAPVVVSLRVIGVEDDCVVVIGNGAVIIPLFHFGGTPVNQLRHLVNCNRAQIIYQFPGTFVIGTRACVLAGVGFGVATAGVGGRYLAPIAACQCDLSVGGGCALEFDDGAVVIAGVQQGVAGRYQLRCINAGCIAGGRSNRRVATGFPPLAISLRFWHRSFTPRGSRIA